MTFPKRSNCPIFNCLFSLLLTTALGLYGNQLHTYLPVSVSQLHRYLSVVYWALQLVTEIAGCTKGGFIFGKCFSPGASALPKNKPLLGATRNFCTSFRAQKKTDKYL